MTADTIRRLRNHSLAVRKEHERHQWMLANLARDLAQIQSECPHDKTTYQGDPTGGTDGFDRCMVCGKVV